MSRVIYLATDHAGYALKEYIKERLVEAGYSVEDCGAKTLEKDDDYPDFIRRAAKKVQESEENRGVIFGHSGQGEAIAANRFKGVRAAVYYGGTQDILTLSREHNDANVLSLGAGFLTEEEAWSALTLWLTTVFSEAERHVRRIKKIDD